MQIIFVSRHLKTAKTVTIMPRHLVLATFVLLFSVFATSATFSWLSMEFRLPLVQDLMTYLQRKETKKSQEVMSNNLDLMATRLGELQAQVIQLDSLGERLSNIAGVRRDIPVEKSKPAGAPLAQGGPFIPAPMNYNLLQQEIERLTKSVEFKTDELAMLEASLLEKKVRERLLPTTLPVRGASIGSGYGHRSDPFAGSRAMHEGIDFNIGSGAPVVAAAAGVVLVAEYHPEFGNMIDIDHGDGLISRYAHLSRIDIQSGRMVRRGERIGLVGSTGRSTGSHLHFEVRMLGVAQNPAVFLKKGSEFAQIKTR